MVGASHSGGGAARFSHRCLVSFAAEVFAALGFGEHSAATAAEAVVLADLRGVESHGLARLPGYAARLHKGLIAVDAELTVDRETTATIALDAHNGLGLVQAPAAMARCIDKAEQSGLCFATVRRSNHFGIAGAYALMATRRGLGGIAMTNASPLVVPVFGAEAKLGTNPIAIAVPTGVGPDDPPLVLDMATSAVAWGKIEIARRNGTDIPLGWAVDDDGMPTTDPFAARWLTPLGGERAHKGYALATMVDVLCGPLAGSAWSAHVAGSRGPELPASIGHAFLAWRIDAFRDPAAFYRDLGAVLRELRSTPPATGQEATGVLAPGDPELQAEAEHLRAGIPLNRQVVAALTHLAEELGVPFPDAEPVPTAG